MDQELFGIKDFDVYLVTGILFFFSLVEVLFGQLKNSKRTFSDWIQEAGSAIVLSILIKPLLVIVVFYLGSAILPEYHLTLSNVSVWLLLPLYLFVDDVLQYWYHRSAHEYDFLWKLHRPHHQAEEMGFFVSYRNAALYYFMMPNIWWVSIITFLGGGIAVAIGLILKQLVIIGAHSSVKWDKPLYQLPLIKNIMWLIERIIVTPAFHHAHHGKSKIDGISAPNRNFGNMFSIWDQLFNSAVFTRKFPVDYGLPNDPKEHWTAAYLYPLVASDNPASELSRGFTKEDTTTLEPTTIELKQGEKILWCQCGKSKNQPFCDGSHHGTKHTPLLYEAQRDQKIKLCNCKLTKKGPFCDGSHNWPLKK